MLGSKRRTRSAGTSSQKSTVTARHHQQPHQHHRKLRSSKRQLTPEVAPAPAPAKRRRLELEDLASNEKLSDLDEAPKEKACGRFNILEELGGGAYGTVFKAIDKERDGEVVALKKLVVLEEAHIGIPPHIMREVANLQYLSSRKGDYEPPIVRLLDMEYMEGRYAHEMILYLVFEHMEQDLDSFIRRHSPKGLPERVVKNFLRQILTGVDWMHVNNIVHRDLKPQNILVSHDSRIKIADFGLSRIINSRVILSTQVVTQWYRAPEVLLHSSYCKPVDIWSVGCVFAEMYHGKPLFDAEKRGEKAQLEKIFSVVGTPANDDWPMQTSITLDQFTQYRPQPWSQVLPEGSKLSQSLLSRMLVLKAENRVTAQEALRDSYFDDDDEGEGDSGVCNSPGGTSSSSVTSAITLCSNSSSSVHGTVLDIEDLSSGSLDSGIY